MGWVISGSLKSREGACSGDSSSNSSNDTGSDNGSSSSRGMSDIGSEWVSLLEQGAEEDRYNSIITDDYNNLLICF